MREWSIVPVCRPHSLEPHSVSLVIRTLIPGRGGVFAFCTLRFFFVRYRLDDALDGFTVYNLGGFILVPLMGRIRDLKIKLIKLRS